MVQACPCWGPSTPFHCLQRAWGPLQLQSSRPLPSFGCPPCTPPLAPHLRPVPWQQRAPVPGSQRSPREGSQAESGEGGAAGADKQTFCSPGCCQPGISPGPGWGPRREWVLRAKWAGGRQALAVHTDPPAHGLPPSAQSPQFGQGRELTRTCH